ncbi:MAG: glycosyltransferase family 2 protein [Chloroflexota bacterium]
MSAPLLTICIATYNRARFIGETLDSIVGQLTPDVELLVLDGASPDDTAAVVAARPGARYVCEPTNSGVDRDYDKAVGHARGRYCWLMTDDDLLLPGAVARVLAALADDPALLVVNAEVRSIDFAIPLQARLLDFAADRDYPVTHAKAFFEEVAAHLKFIGAVVVDREAWLGRAREPYYGTLFIHAGVIFQSPPIGLARVLAEPVMVIRYGNAMWTPRGFEIWMYKWPGLVWSFDGYDDASKARVCAREPWRKLVKLGVQRGLGGLSPEEVARHFGAGTPWTARAKARFAAAFPAPLANTIACVACLAMPRKSRLNLYDLARSRHATFISRKIAELLGV